MSGFPATSNGTDVLVTAARLCGGSGVAARGPALEAAV
jgi:hypothetical protein